MKKLLFFDLDGTLTDETTGIIPESTKQAICLARENGHLCFLNSGRTFAIIEDTFKNMMDGTVCGLGTYIEYNHQPLLHKTLDSELCHYIMNLAIECNIDCYFEGKNGVMPLEHSRFEFFQQLNEKYIEMKFPMIYYPNDSISFEKFCIMKDETGDYERFDEYVCQYFRKIDRGNGFYEYEQLGCSKATGIDFLCEYFETSLDNCYVFGDSTNDLPMLTHVKHSVLMENGAKELRKHVEYVTTNSGKDGIEHALRHYNLI